jgi:hypothetical protein
VIPYADDVALMELVLEQKKQAGEIVLHQALRAEADGQARDARGPEDRRHGDAQLCQHQHACQQRHHHRHRVAQHAPQGRRAQHGIAIAKTGRDALAHGTDAPLQQDDGQPGGQNDSDDPQPGAPPRRRLRQPIERELILHR